MSYNKQVQQETSATPVFSSAARLATLARFVANTSQMDNGGSTTHTDRRLSGPQFGYQAPAQSQPQSQPASSAQPVSMEPRAPDEDYYPSPQQNSTPIQPRYTRYPPVQTTYRPQPNKGTFRPYVNGSVANRHFKIKPTLINARHRNTNSQDSQAGAAESIPLAKELSVGGVDNASLPAAPKSASSFQGGDPVFSVWSAGFPHGNYAEVRFGDKTHLPPSLARRGMCMLCLNHNHTSFHAWQFDFYPNPSRFATNRNFVDLLRKLPARVYFCLTLKDDAEKNLFEDTKRFLTNVVGCKEIRNIQYRDSWCMIGYKPTLYSFQVLKEHLNPHGVAFVEVPIPKDGQPQGTNQAITSTDISVPAPQVIEPERSFQVNQDPVQAYQPQNSYPSMPAPYQPPLQQSVYQTPPAQPQQRYQAPPPPQQTYQAPPQPQYQPQYQPPVPAAQIPMTEEELTGEQPVAEPPRSRRQSHHSSRKEKRSRDDSASPAHREVEEQRTIAPQLPIIQTSKKTAHEEAVMRKEMEKVRRELSKHLFLLQDLKKESDSIKDQIKSQVDSIKTIKKIVENNDVVIKDLLRVMSEVQQNVKPAPKRKRQTKARTTAAAASQVINVT